MKPLVQFPPFVLATVDLVQSYLDEFTDGATAGVAVPDDWSPDGSDPFVKVSTDGTPLMGWPIVGWPTVRVVVFSAHPGVSDDIARLVQGCLCAHQGGDGITHYAPLSGPLGDRDPASGAELAAFTVRATVRTVPIEAIGS